MDDLYRGIPEESISFVSFDVITNLKGLIGLILFKDSVVRVSNRLVYIRVKTKVQPSLYLEYHRLENVNI